MKGKKVFYIAMFFAIIFMLFRCEGRDSREYLEERIGNQISRVYPTKNLEDLFEQFPEGFTIYQGYILADKIIKIKVVLMEKKIIIAPSLLAADFSKLKEEISEIEKYGAEYLHLDVMDGNYVPNISFGAPIISSIRKHSNLVFDVHLMVENPDMFIKDMVDVGADIITVHVEATKHLNRTVQLIKSYGKKVGIALNPSTPLEMIKYDLKNIDMVLIMTVNPGFGGQKFIEDMTEKIRELRKINKDIDIEVDGGINAETAKKVKEAGANILVAGSYVFSGNYKEKIESLK